MSVMMFIFGVIGMTTSSMLGALAFVYVVNFFLRTTTRVEIRTRKRLKRTYTDHYAATLEYALYGKVITGGNKSCSVHSSNWFPDSHVHPYVEPLTEETGKLPIPVGYPGYREPYTEQPVTGFQKKPRVICGECNGIDHHWSWCPTNVPPKEGPINSTDGSVVKLWLPEGTHTHNG